MKKEQELKEILFDLFDDNDDADEIKDILRSMVSEWQLEQKDYDTILENWDEWLGEWHNENFDSPDHHPIQKHGDYDKNETIHIERVSEEWYRLFYEAENYEFFGDKEEVLEELSEHLELKKF